MSRRSYKKIEQQPLPPFYENLVFWAPLTEGDLTDHISGSTLSKYSGCSATYDTTKQSYRFNCKSTAGNINNNFWWDNLNLGIFSDDSLAENINMTITCIYEDITYDANNRWFPTVSNVVSSSSYCYLIPTPQSVVWTIKPFVKARYTMVWDNGTAYLYQDSKLITTYTAEFSGSLAKSNLNKKIVLSPMYVKFNRHYFDGYMQDIRVYNRALTAEEVAQL